MSTMVGAGGADAAHARMDHIRVVANHLVVFEGVLPIALVLAARAQLTGLEPEIAALQRQPRAGRVVALDHREIDQAVGVAAVHAVVFAEALGVLVAV